MPLPLIIAGAAAIAQIGSSLIGMGKARSAGKAIGKANKLQKQIDILRYTRMQRDAIRASRIAQGALANRAEINSVGNSSGALGGEGVLQTLLGSNLGFANTDFLLQMKKSKRIGEAQQLSNQAETWKGIGDIFGSISSYASAYGAAHPAPGAPPPSTGAPSGGQSGSFSTLGQPNYSQGGQVSLANASPFYPSY